MHIPMERASHESTCSHEGISVQQRAETRREKVHAPPTNCRVMRCKYLTTGDNNSPTCRVNKTMKRYAASILQRPIVEERRGSSERRGELIFARMRERARLPWPGHGRQRLGGRGGPAPPRPTYIPFSNAHAHTDTGRGAQSQLRCSNTLGNDMYAYTMDPACLTYSQIRL